MTSHEVDWLAVATFVAPLIERFARLPIPGSPAWCQLSDHNPAKLAACLLYVRYWAYDAACRQQAQVAASRDIAAAADWSGIAHRRLQRERFYAEKPWLKRLFT